MKYNPAQGYLVLGGQTIERRDFLKEVREQVPEEVGKEWGWAVSEGITEQRKAEKGEAGETACTKAAWLEKTWLI